MDITTKQFRKETDLDLVWDFMAEIYDREKGGGLEVLRRRVDVRLLEVRLGGRVHADPLL